MTISSEQMIGDENTYLLSTQISQGTKKNDLRLWDPWLISVWVTILGLLPSLILTTIFLYELSGHIWPSTMLAIHAVIGLSSTCLQLQNTITSISSNSCSQNQSSTFRILTSLASVLDVIVCGIIYPFFAGSVKFMFYDVDGELISEWSHLVRILQIAIFGFYLVCCCRLILGGATWWKILSSWFSIWKVCNVNKEEEEKDRWSRRFRVLHEKLHNGLQWMTDSTMIWLQVSETRLATVLLRCLILLWLVAVCWFGFCIQSCIIHLTDWEYTDCFQNLPWRELPPTLCCDGMDPTECALPFPSFHHMVQDETTKTGWRVALESNSLPYLRGGIPLSPGFWNELDGFSTMAPILFYGLDGLKESHMLLQRGSKVGVYPRLVDDDIAASITERSITLLWDVERNQLIPHTTQFDDLNPKEPLIMLIPAQPLRHGTHYAVAIVSATNVNGERIPPTSGMKQIWNRAVSPSEGICIRDSNRRRRYLDVLLPSLYKAAPWIAATHTPHTTDDIQLMFDFMTMSRDSLQTIERVRDATLEAIDSWKNHSMEVVKIENNNCHDPETLIARTIHGRIQVPWFLESYTRNSFLSMTRLPFHGSRLPTGWAKFSVRVPCSLREAALGSSNVTNRVSRRLRAVIDYGHGLFFNRGESFEYSLARLAEDNGYIIMAMDWRGMSSFDLPVVMRTLLGQPSLFQATRDNIYQGYANKIVLQHYAKHEMLVADWLRFPTSRCRLCPLKSIPLSNETEYPAFVFWGASQGGILGAGYTTLIGTTYLIDRGILGVPGTSFSLVLSRSAEFGTYESLLIRNFHSTRQIRLILSIVQLGWDPVEAAGQLAPPLPPDAFPRILLQSALGDPVIPREATEALARAYNASVLSNSPRTHIFGVPMTNMSSSSHVIWTELLYQEAYGSLPVVSNRFPPQTSVKVHACVRQDCPLIGQIATFINMGKIIDPCWEDGCLRTSISCHAPWIGISTKPENWKCTTCAMAGRGNTTDANSTFCQ